MRTSSSQFVWVEPHQGVECASPPHEFSVLPLRLNTCSAPDASNALYHKFSCKLGDFKVSLIRQDYDDTACSPSTKHGSPFLLEHDFYCRADTRTGAYVRTVCGDLTQIADKPQLLLRWFPATSKKAPTCAVADAVTHVLLLGRCLPQSRALSRDKSVTYYYTLSYASSTASAIMLTEKRFEKEDKSCKGPGFLTKAVQYSRAVMPASCANDPVSPATGSYAAALYHNGSATSWPRAVSFFSTAK